MSEVPCTSVRASIGVRSAITVEAATVAHDQPSPSRKRPGEDLPRRALGREPQSASETSSTTPPVDQDARAAEPVGRPPDHRREGEHAEHVDRDDEPDDLEVRAAVLHVERRHDHHRHHRRVGARHRDHGRTDGRHVADHLDEAPPRAAAGLDAVGRRQAGRRLRHEQRVGPQPHPDPAGREDEHDGADGEAARELGDARAAGGRAARRRRGWGRRPRRWSWPTRRPRAPARGAPRSRGRWRRSATRC